MSKSHTATAEARPATIIESCDSLTPERLEKARQAFALKVRGQTQDEIGESLGISRSTVVRLLTDYKESYARNLIGTPVPHLIAAELARLEEFEETTRSKAESARCEKIRHGYLRIALQAMKTRQDLLLSTGVIPKEPEKVYAIMHSIDSPSGDDCRTDEEIRESIQQLLKHGRKL